MQDSDYFEFFSLKEFSDFQFSTPISITLYEQKTKSLTEQ